MVEGFLLGVIATCSAIAAGFFFKFWRRTGDRFFLAFGAAFVIEAVNRMSVLFVDRPSEGRPLMYVVRLLAFLLIVAAIIDKNRESSRRPGGPRDVPPS